MCVCVVFLFSCFSLSLSVCLSVSVCVCVRGGGVKFQLLSVRPSIQTQTFLLFLLEYFESRVNTWNISTPINVWFW